MAMSKTFFGKDFVRMILQLNNSSIRMQQRAMPTYWGVEATMAIKGECILIFVSVSGYGSSL